MNFNLTHEFEKDLKRLRKKFRSLPEDLENFQRVATVFPLGAGKHTTVLLRKGVIHIVKSRLFCRYLKGASLRIIYAYHEKTGDIELIECLELYHKGEQTREDQKRIEDYLKDF